MSPKQFVETLGRLRASAILRTSIPEAVAPAMAAAVRGGFRVVELTMNTPDVLEHISTLAARTELVVGAGTVLSPEAARAAVGAGARFLVSPVVDEAVIEEAARLGVAVMPGTHTPTEMLRAHRAGAQLQKLFPAPGLGPAFVRATLGPLPFLRIVPTSGVDEHNAAAWLSAGAFAVGFVAPLFREDDLRAGRFDAVEARARRMLAAVAA
jgi:2-dehydro-3-deoxyphosphogluconate aldolase/(4S)-4-hydroxy-2-oxoglutarate aldolase